MCTVVGFYRVPRGIARSTSFSMRPSLPRAPFRCARGRGRRFVSAGASRRLGGNAPSPRGSPRLRDRAQRPSNSTLHFAAPIRCTAYGLRGPTGGCDPLFCAPLVRRTVDITHKKLNGSIFLIISAAFLFSSLLLSFIIQLIVPSEAVFLDLCLAKLFLPYLSSGQVRPQCKQDTILFYVIAFYSDSVPSIPKKVGILGIGQQDV